MAACDGIQDCLANGCDVDLATLPLDDLRKFIGPNAGAVDDPYIEIREREIVLDGVFTFRQLVKLASLLDR